MGDKGLATESITEGEERNLEQQEQSQSAASGENRVVSVGAKAADEELTAGSSSSDATAVSLEADVPENSQGESAMNATSSVVPGTESGVVSGGKGFSRGIMTVIAIVVTLCLVGGGVFLYRDNMRKKAEAEAEKARVQDFNNYVILLEDASNLIISSASLAETSGNLILDVWYNAIMEDDISGWSDETKAYYSTDFNESLDLLFSDPDFQETVGQLEDAEETITDAMSNTFKNPPEGCEAVYESLQTLYVDYCSFLSMVTSPSGSYNSYRQEFSDLDGRLVNEWKLFSTQIPDRIVAEE